MVTQLAGGGILNNIGFDTRTFLLSWEVDSLVRHGGKIASLWCGFRNRVGVSLTALTNQQWES